MPVSQPDVSVVIVSYETRDLTLAAVASVLADRGHDGYEVIVIDNASTDGSAAAVAERYPGVSLIANDENRGFGAAANQGMVVSRGRYVLLLNPDTEVRDDAIAETLAYAEDHADAGVVGCRVFLADGRQQSTVYRVLRLREVLVNLFVPNKLMRRSSVLGRSRYVGLDLDLVQHVEVIAGCFMLVRRDVIERVGVFDEAFFMYGEEEEWCHRIRDAGWRLHYFPGASVLHHGGASAKQFPAAMARAMTRSRLLVLQKTRGRGIAYLGNVLMLLRDLPRILAWCVLAPFPGLRTSSVGRLLHVSVARFPVHASGLLRLDWHPRRERR